MFSIFFNIKVYCVFSLESSQRGDSIEYTQTTIFQYKTENHPATMEYVPRDSRMTSKRDKPAISVRAIEVLL